MTGEAAVKYAMERAEPTMDLRILDMVREEEKAVFDKLLRTETNGVSVYDLLSRLNNTMEENLGVIRHPSRIAEAIAEIRRIREEVTRVRLEDRAATLPHY